MQTHQTQPSRYVIVGGVAGGASALARLRRLDEHAEITLFERGPYISFANCGLPYYVGQVIQRRESLLVQTPEKMKARFGVDIRVNHEVTRIDRANKTVEVCNLASGEHFSQPYDKLLLATGSSPLRPPIEGIEEEGIFTIWTIPDTDQIVSYINEKQAQSALIAGGGFIGLEMAENLCELGLKVQLAELAPQVMLPFDQDMADTISRKLIENGVELYLGNGVKSFSKDPQTGQITTCLSGGEILQSDLVILALGVRPNSLLAKEADLNLNQRGGVLVNAKLETSDPDIYAIGDVIEVENLVSGEPTMIPLAGPANKQGRIAAGNISGRDPGEYHGSQGTGIFKMFDQTYASVGLNEKQLNADGKAKNKHYGVSLIHINDHAGYYPGARQMTIKLIFGLPEGRILGAQIAGFEGVDKRIDVISTVQRMNGTVYDLSALELAYAPPYSSAKDPVNMVAFVALNQLQGFSQTISVAEMDELLKQNPAAAILDIQERPERDIGFIPDSIHIPLSELRDRLNELDQDRTYICYCAIGLRGYIAERILRQNGINALNLAGGIKSYRLAHAPTGPHTPPACVETNLQDDGVMAIDDSKCEVPQSMEQASENLFPDTITLDACGMSCPGPIMEVAQKISEIDSDAYLEVKATDPGFARDIESWCENTGNTLIRHGEKDGYYFAIIRKGYHHEMSEKQAGCVMQAAGGKEKTMIIFDGDLDKAIAAFIIANGARAMGNEVHMFFTFWGLNIIRKNQKVHTQKDFLSKMFGWMMPRGSKKLGLSKMNMLGMGPKMIRHVMKKKNVNSLEDLIVSAMRSGVKITACQMSMDVMGINQAELLDGVEIGGVATMLADNDRSNMNLFI